MKLGTFALRTVGSVVFLEDSEGIVMVDVRKLAVGAAEDVNPTAVGEFIVMACNSYHGDRDVGRDKYRTGA